MTEFFLSRLVANLRAELPEDRRAKFDEWAAGRTLEEQRQALVSAAMKGWREPEHFAKPIQKELPLAPRTPYRDD